MGNDLKYITVAEAYESFMSDCVKVQKGAFVYEAIEALLRNPMAQTIYVVDKNGKLMGIIPIRDLIKVANARHGVKSKGISGFMSYISNVMKDGVDEIMRPPLMVEKEDDLKKAMRIMGSYDLDNLPVVDKKKRLLGEINGIEILKFSLEGIKKGEIKFEAHKKKEKDEKE